MITPALLQRGLSYHHFYSINAHWLRQDAPTLAATLTIASASHSAILTCSSRVSHLFRSSSGKRSHSDPTPFNGQPSTSSVQPQLTALAKPASSTGLTASLKVTTVALGLC